MHYVADDDKQRLKRVLDIADDILGKCCGPWADLLFSNPFRDKLKEAWAEVKPVIAKVRDDIDNDGSLEPDLARAGLTGKQLAAKTTALFGWYSKFKRLGSFSILKRVLKWLNTILGSLASAIPGGEGIKELKESVENGIEDGEDGGFEDDQGTSS